ELAKEATDREFAAALVQLLNGADEFTLYRAAHDDRPLGLYVIEREARAHCEDFAARQIPDDTVPSFDWIGDDEDDDPWELVAAFDGTDQTTGYSVTPLTVSLAYDPAGDQ
ncbi:hypothetical protein J0695_39245, partial [Streptomyces beijiangensis]|nr:hypothetical protein [Streptomyces beijiangensis]